MKPHRLIGLWGSKYKEPAITYSRAGRTTIGPRFFTAVFGMGTGVVTWVRSPASCINIIGNLVGHEADTSEKRNNAAKRSAVSTG